MEAYTALTTETTLWKLWIMGRRGKTKSYHMGEDWIFALIFDHFYLESTAIFD